MRLIQNAHAIETFVNNLGKPKVAADALLKLKSAVEKLTEQIPQLIEKGFSKEETLDKIDNPFKLSNLRDPAVFDELINSMIDSYMR